MEVRADRATQRERYVGADGGPGTGECESIPVRRCGGGS